jgi:hypothetical protein
MSTAPAAVAASVAAIAVASLNAPLLLFCIVPPHANVFADDYYKFRVGISPIHGFRGKSQQTACHPPWKWTVCGFRVAGGQLFALLARPGTAGAFILHADREQNASASAVRLGFEGHVAGTQHEMPDAATIEVRRLTTCRRSVPFL